MRSIHTALALILFWASPSLAENKIIIFAPWDDTGDAKYVCADRDGYRIYARGIHEQLTNDAAVGTSALGTTNVGEILARAGSTSGLWYRVPIDPFFAPVSCGSLPTTFEVENILDDDSFEAVAERDSCCRMSDFK